MFDLHTENALERSLCLFDEVSGDWAGAGIIDFAQRRASNVHSQPLHAESRHTYVLDGDNVRHGLNRDLGFTEVDRLENIRSAGRSPG